MICITCEKVYWVIKNWTPTNRRYQSEVSTLSPRQPLIYLQGTSLRSSCKYIVRTIYNRSRSILATPGCSAAQWPTFCLTLVQKILIKKSVSDWLLKKHIIKKNTGENMNFSIDQIHTKSTPITIGLTSRKWLPLTTSPNQTSESGVYKWATCFWLDLSLTSLLISRNAYNHFFTF